VFSFEVDVRSFHIFLLLFHREVLVRFIRNSSLLVTPLFFYSFEIKFINYFCCVFSPRCPLETWEIESRKRAKGAKRKRFIKDSCFSFSERTLIARVAESELFGWSRIPKNTGSLTLCQIPDVQLNQFLNHTPKLGIRWIDTISYEAFVETDHNSCCAPRFPLICC